MRLPTSLAVLPLALAALLLGAGPASAQQPPIPNPAEIKKKIRAAFPKLVEAAEVDKITFGEGDIVTISYKKIPTDPKDIAKALGKDIGTDKIPDQMLDQYIGMFAPQIAEVLNEHLKDIGELINTKTIKIKSKRIPPGKHRIGLVFKGEKPDSVVIFDKKDHMEEGQKKLKKPIVIKLKTKSSGIKKTVELKLKEPKKKKKGKLEFDLFVSALRYEAKIKKPLEIID